MTKTNKVLLSAFIIVVTIVVLVVFKSTNQVQSPKNLSVQEKEEGNVIITAKPEILSVGQKPKFELEFNTHSVDLSFDVAVQSYLVDDQGNRFDNEIWNGSPSGGHHRDGTLIFNTVLSKTKFVKLIIRNVSDIPERTFRWEL